MKYDINRPWLTLDPWQKEYCFYPDPNQDNFLLCGRQSGKTTAMSIRAVELCVKHFKKGEFVLINSITEKQAYHMLAKSLAYAMERYPKKVVAKGPDKPTKHKIIFKNGSGILCYAAGETGEGLRGFTIKKLMPDEGSRMSEEYFISTIPMLSVVGGSMDIASTPAGTVDLDGNETFFYRCSKDPKFKKYYVSAEDCPRHSKEFLERQRNSMTKLEYAQEFKAEFLDQLLQYFPTQLIKDRMTISPNDNKIKGFIYFLGVDIARMGGDQSTYVIVEKQNDGVLNVKRVLSSKNMRTTYVIAEIKRLHRYWGFRKIYIDDGGLGAAVFDILLEDEEVRGVIEGINNSTKSITRDKNPRRRRILKEDTYSNTLALLEHKKLNLVKDDDLLRSMLSVMYEPAMEGRVKIKGRFDHITEGLVRACWCTKDKGLNIWITSI